jgi:hypothetical protein
MLEAPGSIAAAHPNLAFWLDESIKMGAVAVGALWTLWNYTKSRTYQQKMELKLAGSIFRDADVYIEVIATLKNLGASRHTVQRDGSYCEVLAVFEDLSEQEVKIVRVFEDEEFVEPGESVSDLLLFRLTSQPQRILWLRINLRVVSKGVEWRQVDFIRVASETPAASYAEGN